MTWGAVAAAAVTVIGTVVSAATAGDPTSQTTSQSQPEFPEVTRRIIGDVEFPLLRSGIQEQTNLGLAFAPGALDTTGILGRRTEGPMQAVQSAATKGAETAGISDLGPIFENVFGLQPEFLESLRTLVMQRGAQTRGVVSPGFLPFLQPARTSQSTTTQAGPSAVETGFALASNLGKIAGGLNSAGVFGSG